MTKNELIECAASGYPDAYILNYWDLENSCPRQNPEAGDTLAEFIARELQDNYDQDASDAEQIATAVSVIQAAVDELQDVSHTLSDRAVRRAA